MARIRWTRLAILAALGLLPGCVVGTVTDTTPAPSQAVTYAAPGYVYSGAPVAVEPVDSYCAEAVGEAQAAATQAAVTGTVRDANRAQRAAGYARRDC